MLCHGFTGSESPWDCCCSALCDWEHRIQNTLSSYQRYACRISLMHRSCYSDRPFLCHSQFLNIPIRTLDLYQHFINGVISIRNDIYYFCYFNLRRHHTFVYNCAGLRHFCNYRSAVYYITLFYRQMSLPFLFSIQGINRYTSGNKCTTLISDTFQRSLNSVKDIIQDTRCQRY